MRCPVCRAENTEETTCRRCRADLSLLAALEQARRADALGVGAHARAVARLVSGHAGGGADGAVELRRAEAVEEARGDPLALHDAHRPGVGEGEDGLRAVR